MLKAVASFYHTKNNFACFCVKEETLNNSFRSQRTYVCHVPSRQTQELSRRLSAVELSVVLDRKLMRLPAQTSGHVLGCT